MSPSVCPAMCPAACVCSAVCPGIWSACALSVCPAVCPAVCVPYNVFCCVPCDVSSSVPCSVVFCVPAEAVGMTGHHMQSACRDHSLCRVQGQVLPDAAASSAVGSLITTPQSGFSAQKSKGIKKKEGRGFLF